MKYLIKGKEYTEIEAYNKFIDDFIGLIEEYRKYEVSDDCEIVKSYANSLAQTDRDPIRDADTVESDLYDMGWDDDNLKKIFTQYRTEIIQNLEEESRGGFDVFLYNWTNGDFPLGGYSLNEKEYDEILIKYSYGWNRTKYGKLYLEQNNLYNNFTNIVANAYLNVTFKYIIRTLMCPGNIANNYSSKEVMDKTFIKITKFVHMEDNKITIDYKKIADIINLVMFINDKSKSEELYSYDEILNTLKNVTNSELELGTQENKLNIDFKVDDNDNLVISFN